MGKVVNGVYVSDVPGISEKQRVEEAMQYYGQHGMTGELESAWNYYQTLGSSPSSSTPKVNDSVVTPSYNVGSPSVGTMNPKTVATGGAAGTGAGQPMTSFLNSIGGSWGYDPTSNSVMVNGKQYNWNGQGYGIPGASWNPGTNLNYISDPTAFLAATGLGGLVQTNQTQDLLTQLLSQQNPMTAQDMQSMIMGMVQQPEWAQGIDYQQGLDRATAALAPRYELSLQDTLKKLAGNQISRGFYGQLPADVLTQEAAARLEAEKNAAIASEANSLVDQSMNQAYQQNSLNQSMYGTQLQLALQAAQQAQSSQQDRIAGLLSLLGLQNDQFNTSGQMNLNTTQTLAAVNSQAKADALARWQMAGRIMSQEDADLLGVPVGTSTEEALYHSASLAASRSGGGGGGGGGKVEDWTADALNVISAYFNSEIGYNSAMAQLNGLYAAGKINAAVYNSAVSQIESNFQANNPTPVANSPGPGGNMLNTFLSNLRAAKPLTLMPGGTFSGRYGGR